MNYFPLPDEQVVIAYTKLVFEIDKRVSELTAEHFATVLQCAPGCSDCCMRFSVLPLEAALVRKRLDTAEPFSSKEEIKCVMLSDDLCRIYEIRPVICRTQGVPVAYIDEEAGAIEVSACQLNFAADYPLTHDHLLFMDQFNSRLYELNQQYCQTNGLEPAQRIPITDLVSCS